MQNLCNSSCLIFFKTSWFSNFWHFTILLWQLSAQVVIVDFFLFWISVSYKFKKNWIIEILQTVKSSQFNWKTTLFPILIASYSAIAKSMQLLMSHFFKTSWFSNFWRVWVESMESGLLILAVVVSLVEYKFLSRNTFQAFK